MGLDLGLADRSESFLDEALELLRVGARRGGHGFIPRERPASDGDAEMGSAMVRILYSRDGYYIEVLKSHKFPRLPRPGRDSQ
jgi:hypothetical protein